MSKPSRSLGDVLQEFSQHRQLMQEELQKIIVGQSEVIEQLFAAVRLTRILEGTSEIQKMTISRMIMKELGDT